MLYIYLLSVISLWDWPMYGHDLENTHLQGGKGTIIKEPDIKWTYEMNSIESFGAAIGDVDDDNVSEVIFAGVSVTIGPTFHYKLYCLNGTIGSLKWSYEVSNGIASCPAIGDIDGNNSGKEIVFGSNNGALYCLWNDGTLRWSFQADYEINSSPALADLNNNNTLEIVFTDDQYLYIVDKAKTLLCKYRPNIGPTLSVNPAVGDIDNDGAPEILFSKSSSSVGRKVYAIDCPSFLPKWSNPSDLGANIECSPAITKTDIDGDGTNDIIIACNSGNIFALKGSDGTIIWTCSTPYDADGIKASPAIADINNDTEEEAVIGSMNGYLYALKVEDGSILWNFTASNFVPHRAVAIADINGDNNLEIITPNYTGSAMYCLSGTGSVLWSKTISYDIHDPTIGDIDNDGVLEIVVGPRGPALYALDYTFDTLTHYGWLPQETPSSIVRSINGHWAVGDNGVVLKRDDKSEWSPVTIPGIDQGAWDFQGVCEVNSNLTYIVGSNIMMKTARGFWTLRGIILKYDGSWTHIYSNDPDIQAALGGYNLPFYSVDFANDQIGYIGTAGGYVLKTIDGCNSWISISRPVPEYEPYEPCINNPHFSDCVKSIWVDKINSDHAWATLDNRGYIARTRSGGGINWDISEQPTEFNNEQSLSNPYGWGSWPGSSPILHERICHAKFGVKGFKSDPSLCLLGISTGGKGSYVDPSWSIDNIDNNTPNGSHPNRIMYPTWFTNIWNANPYGTFYAATSDAIYANIFPNLFREHFLKEDDLYSIYSDGNEGWMAWAVGRHPNTSGTPAEEGTILGRYKAPPLVGRITATGVSGGVQIDLNTGNEDFGSNKVHLYGIYRSPCKEGPYILWLKHFFPQYQLNNHYSYTDNTVTKSMPYWYKIKITWNDGWSNRQAELWTEPFTATPSGLPVPTLPGNPSVSLGSSLREHGKEAEWSIQWTANLSGGGYLIYRSEESSNGPYEYIGLRLGVFGTTIEYRDATGEVGREYFYTVRTIDTDGVPSSFSFDETPPASGYYAMTGFSNDRIPPQVTCRTIYCGNLSSTTNNKVVRITWDPVPYTGTSWGNHEPYLGGYWVECNEKPIPSSKWIPIKEGLCTLSPIQRTWYESMVSGPDIETSTFRVAAMDRSGNIGEWSAPVTINTMKDWHYVDQICGYDGNPGTKELPWATIQKAANTLEAGEAVLVKGGVYHETVTPYNSGDTDSGSIYYLAYPGEEVVITGDNTRDYGFNVTGKSHIVICGFDIKECTNAGVLYDNALYGEVRNTKIHNNEVGIKNISSSLLCRENTIVANNIGVSTNVGAGVNIGNPSRFNAEYNPGNNGIYSNSTWNLFNSAGDSILTQSNYWGTGDSATIAGTVSGPVIFMPIKTILPPDWQIQVKATSNFAIDTSNYAGVVGEASDDCDEGYDIIKFPNPPSNYVYLDFPHPEWNHPLGDKFCQDIRKTVDLTDSTMIWNFEVNTDKSSENITITINPTDVPSGYGIYLLDLVNGTTQDMKSNPNYVYNSGGGGIHQFQLSVGLRGINHGGADWVWTTDSTRTVYDRHYNIGLFKINSAAVMKVTPYDGVDTVTGKLRVESKTMEIVGILSADSSGYVAETGPGAGVRGSSMHGGSGAGYGGRGGHGGSNIQGDTTYHGGYAYGITSSFLLGSGGGNSDPTLWGKGGRGAGAVKLKCSSSITLSGTLRANGKPGTGSDGKVGGGGSGGSLIIQTVSLSGNGTISAKGGNGSHDPSPGSTDGGGAAGGRVNITYTTSTFAGRIDVSGGEGPYNAIDGQPGTALMQSGDNNVALLSPVNTATNSDSRNGFIKGVEFTDNWIRLTANDSIVGNVELSAADSIIINSSSYIISSSKGYAHNQGTGYGHAGSSSHGGGGAGYGGIGGHGNYYTPGGTGDGGITYPDSLLPDSLGSGGGDYGTVSGYCWGGGAGGGKIKLNCRYGKVLINGNLLTNGANGISKTSYASGGGTGGSVLIYAKYLAGSGTIQAKGGNGGAISNCYGGGGAGGRICLYRDSTDFSGSISVAGGVKGGYGATDGNPGTINEDYIPYGGGTQGNTVKKPLVFKLYQNYPNPFMNKTTIQYSIPKTTMVSLKIYDVSGRCVKTLVDGNKVPGYYKESLEAKDYPTGVYFARLKTKEYSETRKMVLMK